MEGSDWGSDMREQELEPVGDAWILKEKAAECGEMVPWLCWEGVEVSWWWLTWAERVAQHFVPCDELQ